MRFRLAAFVVPPLLLFAQATGQPAHEGPLYLALGDSLAAGVGASQRVETDYVSLFYAHLQHTPRWRGRSLAVQNLARPGETTVSILRPGGQLDMASAEIRARNGDANANNDVEIISIDIGGNDLLALARDVGCVINPEDQRCRAKLDSAVAAAEVNTYTILQRLRAAAGPKAMILTMTYYNPFSGTGQPLERTADQAVGRLNAAIMNVANDPQVGALVADVFPLFVGRGAELTHVDRYPPDVHPNDGGHTLIAGALIGVLPVVGDSNPDDEAMYLRIYGTIGASLGAVVVVSGVWLIRRRRRSI